MGRHPKDQPPLLVTMQTSLGVASVDLQTQGCEEYEVGLRPLIQSLEKLVMAPDSPKGNLAQVGGGLC